MLLRTRFEWIGVMLLLSVTVLGCQNKRTEQISQPTASPSAQTAEPSTYFPRHLGCRWEYGDSKDEKKLVKHEVVIVGDSTFEIQVSNPNVSFMVFGKDEEWISQQRDRIPDEDLTFEYTPPIAYLKKQLKTGDTWTHDGKGVHDLPRHDEIAVGEVQNITVPAGTFEVLTITRVMKKGDRVDTETEYWAKDVGLVKSEFKSGDYESTLELKSFHIPPK